MPNLGGLEVLAEITEKAPNVPVIVISGAGDMNDVIEALRLGAWDYLTKPITDLAVLEHAICKAIERGKLIEENKIYAAKLEHNLRILEEDQAAGRSVQMRLLPDNDIKLGGYTFSHSVTPSLYLSGDFVEYFRISETKIGLYIADVSGHGASSAFVTVLLKSLVAQCNARFQVHGDKTILLPEHAMEELNYEIHSAKLGKYMTMIYGVIDTETHKFSYGVGGHYPNPIFIDSNGKASYLEGRGFPVGIMASVKYQSSTIEIPKGGKVIMFSDGIMEVFMPDKDMGGKEQGLLKLTENINADIPTIKEAVGISTDLKEQPDDITMLSVSRDPD
jgi:serine phosphatase RsbU (regulator of sigma subunit)